MTNKQLKYITYIFILIVVSSCSSLYIPTTINTPLLEEKGEGQIELSASTNSCLLATSYAFSNKYALMGSFGASYGNFTDSYDLFTKKDYISNDFLYDEDYGEFSHRYGEIGFGRYNILDKRHRKFSQILEVFTGVGYGNAFDINRYYYETEHNYTDQYDIEYFTFFFQGNYGISMKYLTAGGAVKIAGSYFDFSYDDYNYLDNTDEFAKSTQNVTFSMLHVEPMLFAKAGFKRLKFKFQIGLVLNQKFQSFDKLDVYGFHDGTADITWIHMSLGVNYRFNLVKKAKQK